MKRTTFLWTGHTFLDAKKDTFYRFLNNEYFHWRTFIYRLVLKMIAICDETPLRDKTLILDDTIEKKTGKEMELVSYHFDHTTQKSVLGYQLSSTGIPQRQTVLPSRCRIPCLQKPTEHKSKNHR